VVKEELLRAYVMLKILLRISTQELKLFCKWCHLSRNYVCLEDSITDISLQKSLPRKDAVT
jgi:hypothetical protein